MEGFNMTMKYVLHPGRTIFSQTAYLSVFCTVSLEKKCKKKCIK